VIYLFHIKVNGLIILINNSDKNPQKYKTVAKQWQASLSKSGAYKEFYSELEKIFKTTK
jgi:hypothetical protein